MIETVHIGQGWRRRARCLGMDGKNGMPDFTSLDQKTQQKVCRTCPVTLECLNFELQFNTDLTMAHKTGIVYGGLTDRQLMELKKKKREVRA